MQYGAAIPRVGLGTACSTRYPNAMRDLYSLGVYESLLSFSVVRPSLVTAAMWGVLMTIAEAVTHASEPGASLTAAFYGSEAAGRDANGIA